MQGFCYMQRYVPIKTLLQERQERISFCYMQRYVPIKTPSGMLMLFSATSSAICRGMYQLRHYTINQIPFVIKVLLYAEVCTN